MPLHPFPKLFAVRTLAASAAIAALLGAPAARAQEAGAGPEDGWSVEIGLGGSLATGNTEAGNLSGDARATYFGDPWEHDFKLSAVYGQDSDAVNAERYTASAENRYHFNGRLFAYNLLEYQDDRFSGFEYEITENPGLGYRVFETETVDLALKAGPGVRHSRLRQTGDSETEIVGRFAADFDWRISPTSEISNITSIVFSSDRTQIENTLALTTKIYGALATRLSFNVRHNSNPPPGTETTDTLSKVSLVYSF